MPDQTITTRVGDVLVRVQNGQTAYVRAGTGDSDDSLAPLIVRGQPLTVRGHFTRTDAGWTVKRGYLHARRADSMRDTTAAMDRAIADAVSAALNETITDAQLGDAAREAAREAAKSRRADAAALEHCAAALRAEADALDAGGRVVYLASRLSSGAEMRFRTVELPDGTRLQPVTEPPDMRHYAARYALSAAELAAAEERD